MPFGFVFNSLVLKDCQSFSFALGTKLYLKEKKNPKMDVVFTQTCRIYKMEEECSTILMLQ